MNNTSNHIPLLCTCRFSRYFIVSFIIFGTRKDQNTMVEGAYLTIHTLTSLLFLISWYNEGEIERWRISDGGKRLLLPILGV